MHLIIHCYQNLKNYELVNQFCEKLLSIDEFDLNCLIKRGMCQFILYNNSISLKNDIEKALKLSLNDSQRKLMLNIVRSIS